MPRHHKFTAIAAMAALMSGTAGQATDTIYLGDCARAEQVKAQSTIDKLLPYNRYEGIQRSHDGSLTGAATCPPDRVLTYSLNVRSRNTDMLVFDATRQDFVIGAKPTGCNSPYKVQSGLISGTATFRTVLERKGELCEIYIWADFKQSIAGNSSWFGDFSNRLVNLSGGSFVMSQPAPSGNNFATPIAFSGSNQ